jgi:hypothetical protein
MRVFIKSGLLVGMIFPTTGEHFRPEFHIQSFQVSCVKELIVLEQAFFEGNKP